MNIVDDLLRQIRDLERQVRALQRQEVSLTTLGAVAYSGTPTAGAVAYWTGAGTVAQAGSVFYDSTNFRLGLSTTSPDSKLHIVGTNAQTGGITIESSAGTSADRLAIYPLGNFSAAIQLLHASGNLVFYDSSSNVLLSVQSSGPSIIGNGTPAARWHVLESTLGNEVLRLQSTATNDDPRESVYQQRAATTGATETTLWSMAVPSSTTVGIEAWVVARRTGGSSGTAEDGAFYTRTRAVKNVAGTATVIGSGDPAPTTSEDQAGWDCVIDVSGGDVRLRVTGAADNNVTWHATVRTWVVSS